METQLSLGKSIITKGEKVTHYCDINVFCELNLYARRRTLEGCSYHIVSNEEIVLEGKITYILFFHNGSVVTQI